MVQELLGTTFLIMGWPSSTVTPPGHSNSSLLLVCTRSPLTLL